MATFIIGAGTNDAKETAGTVVTTGNGADHDHDAITDWSGLRYEPGQYGNPAGPGEGATITGCSLSLCISTTGADEPDVTIFGHKVVNSAAFAVAANDISGRALTTASVNWNNADLGAAVNQFFSTADLTTVAQELVSQSGWLTTSPITWLIRGSASNTRDLQYRFYEYQGVGGADPVGTYAAVMTLNWTGGGGASGQPLVMRKSGLVVARNTRALRGIYDGSG